MDIIIVKHPRKGGVNMTKLGIAWLDRIETERHNLADETERNRANTASENLRNAELEEAKRHNATEEAEILRHNQEVENENLRAHMADEAIRRSQVTENMRHNLADEQNKLAQNLINQQYYNDQIRVKEIEANAKTTSAEASKTIAAAKKKEAKLKEEMQPYNKWSSVSDTARNFTSAYQTIKGGNIQAIGAIGSLIGAFL